MDYFNSSNNNNSALMHCNITKTTVSPKPSVPSKPTHLKSAKSKGADTSDHEKIVSKPLSSETSKAKVNRIGSLDHVTPKVWSQPQPAKQPKDTTKCEIKSQTEIPKSLFSSQWRPAPRPKSLKSIEKATDYTHNSNEDKPSNQTCTNADGPSVPIPLELAKPKVIKDNEKLHYSESANSNLSLPSPEGDTSRSNSSLKYRPSFTRDPKSPGFGTIRRMWVTKPNSDSLTPKPFSVVPCSRREAFKKSHNHSTSSDTAGGWYHVNSPSNPSNETESVVDSSDMSTSINILSPKPFRNPSVSDEQSSSIVSRTTSTISEEESGSETKSNSTNAELGVYEDFEQTQSEPVEITDAVDVGIYNGMESVSENEQYRTSLWKDKTLLLSDEDLDNQAPPVPPHERIPAASAQTFEPAQSTSPHDYVPMSGRKSEIPEFRYVDMASDVEWKVEAATYGGHVVPPPPVSQTKSKREYHEIDPDVPPPPNRDPPKLPQAKSHLPPSTQSQEDNEYSEEPPPLPPDNTVGRRSMIYSKNQKLEVVRNLRNAISNNSDGATAKKLNYVEVDTGLFDRTKKYSPISCPKINYSEVVVGMDGDVTRDRSGSGTSDEGLSTASNKKQKNVKQKIQSLFTKEEPKTGRTKESQETTTDFEKERNKKKRISGRFLKKKITKDAIKAKKDAQNEPSNYEAEAAVYVDYAESNVTSGVSISSNAPSVVASGSSSSHSSGDGEVARIPPSIAAQSYGNVSAKVPPTSCGVTERKMSMDELNSISALPPRGQADEPFSKSLNQGQIESTFVAYPAQQASTEDSSSYDNFHEELESRQKVSSFLHGTSNDLSGLYKLRSEPPNPTPKKRLSAPVAAEPPRPKPLQRPLSEQQFSPPTVPPHGHFASNTSIPLPGMVSLLPQPYKAVPESSASPLPPHPPKLPGTQTDGSDQTLYCAAEEWIYADPEAELEHENVYDAAADSSPPPLPERDETLYESISANHQVPPSPFVKEDHASKFLQSEPLYQIYRSRTMTHASAKRHQTDQQRGKAYSEQVGTWERSAFMSEDMGTSTLWRSIPEVVQSGIAEAMTAEEIKLQQAQFEVITSEASYMRSLNILVNHFMRDWAMESPEVLRNADRHRLFSNVETVSAVAKRFLQALEDHFWEDIKLSRVCDLLAQYAKEHFKVYILYIQNQVYQDRVLTKLQRSHERFKEELCRLESSSTCNKLPLLSFLMLPMQRATRLPLLVQAIVNAADSAGNTEMLKKAKHTLGVVNKLVKKCNEGAKKMQQTEQLAEIASQLEYSSSVKMYALVSQSRSLVKKGEMNISISTDSKKASKTSKLWLFLFSDVLLIAKKKSVIDLAGSPPRYEVIDWASRQFIAVNERAASENGIFLVILENQAGKRVEMCLMPLAQNEMSRWELALNPPSTGSAGESIYETWDCPQFLCVDPYIAEQPDELSIEVGDVMQVLKKTSDGWLEGERLRDSEAGWFPSNCCEEIEDEHVRSRNMKNLYRTIGGAS